MPDDWPWFRNQSWSVVFGEFNFENARRSVGCTRLRLQRDYWRGESPISGTDRCHEVLTLRRFGSQGHRALKLKTIQKARFTRNLLNTKFLSEYFGSD